MNAFSIRRERSLRKSRRHTSAPDTSPSCLTEIKAGSSILVLKSHKGFKPGYQGTGKNGVLLNKYR